MNPQSILQGLSSAERDALAARLDQVTDRSGGPLACWPYTGNSVVNGYAVMWVGSGAKNRRMVKLHRLAFELATGEVAPTVDHLCHDAHTCPYGGPTDPHRLCCNPAHLASKTGAQNASRARAGVYREECGQGHQMTEENTYVSPDGARRCRACAATAAAAAREEARAERGLREKVRSYRPRGMSREQLVEWALADQPEDGCWYWPNGKPDAGGYVSVMIDRKHATAHRLVFEVKVGPIPEGQVVDHECHDPEECAGGLLCPHRACIRPSHLAAKTHLQNLAPARSSRKKPTACQAGHEFTAENTYVDSRGSRHCRACASARQTAASKRPERDRTHCKNGLHEMTPENTRHGAKGAVCIACARARGRDWARRSRAGSVRQ